VQIAAPLPIPAPGPSLLAADCNARITMEISFLPPRRRIAAPRTSALALATLCIAVPLVGCSDAREAPVAPTEFVVSSSTLDGSSAWPLNREILISFTADVDFSTASLATIQVVDEDGIPVAGTLSQADPRTVRFQPACPTGDDGSEGGLQPNRTYRLHVATGASVLSTTGQRLAEGLDVRFRTPASTDREVLFHDPVDGAPKVVIDASYVEFGGDPENVEFFHFDPADERGEVASELPLNLYSDPSQQFALVLAFDQPILASGENVAEGRIALEYYHAPASEWRTVSSTAVVEFNCSSSGGASVRVSPVGLLPQGADMRATIRAGFEDLGGQVTTAPQTSFAVFQTTVSQPTVSQSTGAAGQRSRGSDEVLERFTVGGTATGSMEDTSFPSSLPRANWGGGALEAGFDFPGTGGTGGDFDVLVSAGQTVFIDTTSDVIVGGPGGAPTSSQAVINGIVDVRNLTVEQGARLVFIGPNTATVLASGEVRVGGLISMDGGDNFGVGSLNTTNQPEFGAAGQAGGGDGGIGSFLTSQSTPRGGSGSGPFNAPMGGGEGGETSYSNNNCSDFRRGAGGGGGAFGKDVRYYVDEDFSKPLAISQMLVGMDGEPGFTGSPDGLGAVSQSAPARGGALGPRPFTDASPNNDFFGTMVRADGTQVSGELPSVWAGAGGGAGGDAVRSETFPLTPFVNTGDEKGAGGGGGAGGLAIYAVGDIVIEPGGEISATGGSGGGGENTMFFDRIGGGSGGGSGGHIVLSSASSILIQSEVTAASVGPFYRDNPDFARHEHRPLRALGGQGGAGRQDRCGAGADGDTGWRADAIPFDAFEGREDVPPYIPGNIPNTFGWCDDMSTCAIGAVPIGTVVGGGGDGSPGLIQLHVTDPDTQLAFGAAGTTGYQANGIDVTASMAPPPVGWRTPMDKPDAMVPFFSARSESFSRWIPLGLARLNPDGSSNPLEFFFEGTDSDGAVLRDGDVTEELPAIVSYMPLGIGGTAPSIDTLTGTVLVDATAVVDPNTLYSRNPLLLREFAVRFRDSSTPDDAREYPIVTASYDSVTQQFSLALDSMGLDLSSVIRELSARPGDLEFEVVPFYFRLMADGVNDAFPAGTGVHIRFDATIADALTGAPSNAPEAAFSARVDINGTGLDDKNGFTGVIDELNNPVAAPGQTNPSNLILEQVAWDFVRFNVEFDLATGSAAPSAGAPLPAVNFLRVPFRF
jgi:hypothetical protein